jgi:hypothetical protein
MTESARKINISANLFLTFDSEKTQITFRKYTAMNDKIKLNKFESR